MQYTSYEDEYDAFENVADLKYLRKAITNQIFIYGELWGVLALFIFCLPLVFEV